MSPGSFVTFYFYFFVTDIFMSKQQDYLEN